MANRKGFTLIEMLIVLAIIGIVLSIAYPSLVSTVQISKENDRVRQEVTVNKALKQYYALTGRYPNQGIHDPSQKAIPSVEITEGTLGESIYTPIDELLVLMDGLKEQTGINLDVKNYIYTYKNLNNDEVSSYDIGSIEVKPR